MNLGEKIQQLRKSAGLSQEQLAEALGVSRQAISKWETDQSVPELDKLLAISRVFSVSTDELLGNAPTREDDASSPEEDVSSRLNRAVESNMRKRQFTIGWVTALCGLVLLILEYFSLFFMQNLHRQMYGSWMTNAASYAAEPPMPIIFAITVIIIIAGICMAVWGFLGKIKKR